VAQAQLLTKREELRAIILAGKPKSAPALQELIEKIKGRAVQAALDDLQVKKRLEGVRHAVVGADLHDEKPAEGQTLPPRLAEIGVYDYNSNVLVLAILDLRRGGVMNIEERRGLQPLLTAAEEQEAREIVLSDPQFHSLQERSDLQIVSFPERGAFDETDPCYQHRCFRLYFWAGGEPERVGEAVVDLSERRVIPSESDE
jgi:hypothetical protein